MQKIPVEISYNIHGILLPNDDRRRRGRRVQNRPENYTAVAVVELEAPEVDLSLVKPAFTVESTPPPVAPKSIRTIDSPFDVTNTIFYEGRTWMALPLLDEASNGNEVLLRALDPGPRHSFAEYNRQAEADFEPGFNSDRAAVIRRLLANRLIWVNGVTYVADVEPIFEIGFAFNGDLESDNQISTYAVAIDSRTGCLDRDSMTFRADEYEKALAYFETCDDRKGEVPKITPLHAVNLIHDPWPQRLLRQVKDLRNALGLNHGDTFFGPAAPVWLARFGHQTAADAVDEFNELAVPNYPYTTPLADRQFPEELLQRIAASMTRVTSELESALPKDNPDALYEIVLETKSLLTEFENAATSANRPALVGPSP